jgi:hypothetical protein
VKRRRRQIDGLALVGIVPQDMTEMVARYLVDEAWGLVYRGGPPANDQIGSAARQIDQIILRLEMQ